MKRIVLSLALATSLAPMASLAGEMVATTKAAPIARTTVKQLAVWRAEKAATPVDANAKEFRLTQGAIPGAILLTSSSGFELRELPLKKDTRLVFYCANEKCSASEAAAQRAVEAGYTNVSVMPEGLFGWKKAGQSTQIIENS